MNENNLKRIVLVVIVLVATFKILGLGQYLSLSYIKASQGKFALLYAGHKAMVIAIYMLIYILATSLSLPGAVLLTLAEGALFGFCAGTLIVSFASTLGATLACFASRFLLRDCVQSKFGDRLSTFNRGIEQEGTFICSYSD